MRNFAYKALLRGLRSLVYAKRAVVWIFHQLGRLAESLGRVYRRTIGFRVYRLVFFLRKSVGEFTRPWKGQLIELITRRSVLQACLFLLVLFFALPHSKLFAEDSRKVPGRDTLIYKIVGPGDQSFDLEAVTAPIAANEKASPTLTWREGAIGISSAGQGTSSMSEIGAVGISLGGRALNKPTIISSGSAAGTMPVSGERPDIITYHVKAGDTIGSIARRYHISVPSILNVNHLTLRSRIRPGDTLKILPITGATHVVRRGDTIGKIAQIYGASSDEIISFNRLSRQEKNLIVGQELIIPHGKAPTPPAPKQVVRRPEIAPQRFTGEALPASVEAPASSGYVWPAGVRRISQYFGLRHSGVDIAGPIGTPLYAARAGIVALSQCGWNGGYGCYIIIDHGDGADTLYGHTAALFVQTGDAVAQGQPIAAMGSTGHATGPHVHFEIRINGRKVNPLRYIR